MNLFRRIKAWFVDDVPSGLVACEFHCRQQVCAQGRWERCPNRIGRAASERANRGGAADRETRVKETFGPD